MIDLAGKRFGQLIALNPIKKRRRRNVVWRCICDCGNECFIISIYLRKGLTRSCGCLQKELAAKKLTVHGMTDTRIHYIWRGMIQRCENPNHRQYKYWGGRGISVSEEFHDFQTWYEHIGPRPGPEYSQDRIENNGNYERGNIRWTIQHEQRVNSRPISRGPFKQFWFRAWHKNSTAQFMSNSQTKFAKKWELNQACISDCLHGHQKAHRGWIFQKIELRSSL